MFSVSTDENNKKRDSLDDGNVFVVMANVFETSLAIHKKFDLKGSTKGRQVWVFNDLSLTFWLIIC